MPELPEVETIRRGLDRALRGRRIRAVSIAERRLRRLVDDQALGRLAGRRVLGVRRRGKYLLFDLDRSAADAEVFLVHLGMSGRLVLVPSGEPPERHEHVRIRFDRGPVLTFRDPRRFGLIVAGRERDLDELRLLGPDPLAPRPSASGNGLATGLRVTRRRVKTALLDQTLVAGIGNIYACEILHVARVRPGRRGNRLTRGEAERIAAAVPEVLRQAIRLRGTSFSDYVDWAGAPGSFQRMLRVYDREGLPCGTCGNGIRRVVHEGRSSFFCPCCQR